MKRIILFLSILLTSGLVIQAQENPFKKYGVKGEILTLSKGKYKETFYNEEIMRVGTVLINTQTDKVVVFLEPDTTGHVYRAEVTSRFISVDPLCEENYSWSPYVYAMNNPLRFVDPDGMLARDSVGNIIYDVTNKIDDQQNTMTYQMKNGGSVTSQYRYVTIYADDGTPIEVKQVTNSTYMDADGNQQELVGNNKLQAQLGIDVMSNCHGLAFADGQFWLNYEGVNAVLKGDNYRPSNDPLSADVGLVRGYDSAAMGEGVWYHSARADGINMGTFREKDEISRVRTGVPYHQLKNFNGRGRSQVTSYFVKRGR
ncbi:hypothetical protein M2451_003365 [Dysgonomonas sp. PFB1-18]|uniref:hypothetical protein n=1 Tax=unclassified Dysgonomonas TaxID=2630389 RepID=UPI002476D48D|nr:MULTISPECIES: hypothetical protein [unclassified Dysgonomonas]MDH6310545.1 hypothetical protein [Dysgonomonas sp. PF1-14]MDH6340395.1 hypothetical protein [Dysgonomonas sp. PF1-16]MDH6382025.1 hypothetical protein [Dysgonomonas sp. PFB1-18]MDH6399366.1 hypothetical protein [Dysgonomonas sp. PF1-23]